MSYALRSLLCAAASWTVLCGTPLCAQQAPAPQPRHQQEEAYNREDVEALRGRYRPSIHPGDPLRIVGDEQGDNNLRSATPLLARGQHTPLQVDIEASYQRALAMYGDGTLFHTSLPPASKDAPATGAPREHQPPTSPAHQERGPKITHWLLLAAVLVSLLLIGWILRRMRPALMAPNENAPAEPNPFIWRPARDASASSGVSHAEPSSPLPQSRPGITGGARMAQQTKRR